MKFIFFFRFLSLLFALWRIFLCFNFAKWKPHLTLDSGHKERKVDKEDHMITFFFFWKGYYLFCLTF